MKHSHHIFEYNNSKFDSVIFMIKYIVSVEILYGYSLKIYTSYIQIALQIFNRSKKTTICYKLYNSVSKMTAIK